MGRKAPVPSVFSNKVFFIKKESLAQVFFCKFCEIFKNSFFYRTSLVAAFDSTRNAPVFSTKWITHHLLHDSKNVGPCTQRNEASYYSE